MNQNLLKTVLKNEKAFVPLIFTSKQIDILKRRAQGKELSNSQKKALYTSIKKKIEALSLISYENYKENLYISGYENIKAERVEEAKKLVNEYGTKYGKVFVSGSFLFSENYNDIDVFIIRSKGYKEEWKNNLHLIYISESRLSRPIFQSAALISVSNFPITRKISKKRPKLSETMSIYHEAVIELLNKEKNPEMVRNLIFDYYIFCKNKVLNPKTLQFLVKNASLENLANYAKDLLRALFSTNYLYVGIQWYIKTLNEDIKSTQHNKNLIEYKKTYEGLLYGRQRDKGAIA